MADPNQSRGLATEPVVRGANPSEFAPANPTDNRKPLEWDSKYPPVARRAIWGEGFYLLTLLLLTPVLILTIWVEVPKNLLRLTDAKYAPMMQYGFAWLGGMLGGTLFSLKWLYHSVARQIWHLDRRPWRVFTPHISGGLAMGMSTLIASGMFKIFDRHAMESKSLILGMAFLIGYFSDSAIAKLTEIAETLFGASRGREKHIPASFSSAQPGSDPVDDPPDKLLNR